ncbi:MAG TPA: M23 family metallopeptidase [Oscillospiraceae bacterium]|nr:M23 family metallopeptidase [Oscillospiraceae bacterium]HPS35523.1 M23 family metallopeptidase [Oscillospiraceae bacterium]
MYTQKPFFKYIITCTLVLSTLFSFAVPVKSEYDSHVYDSLESFLSEQNSPKPCAFSTVGQSSPEKKLIKWVDFKVPAAAMKKSIALDIASQEKEIQLHFIEMLAYLAAKNGNNFGSYKNQQLDDLAAKLNSGKTIEELTEKMNYYDYYVEAFTAVLGGFVGYYEVEVPNADGQGKHWEQKYGIKVFAPIAKGFYYGHYDDFGTGRGYGFSHRHLGNDLVGSIGTPIIAVESGVIEEMGWNQYGGWRIGIRSLDSKRYYYYAHMRKDFPYKTGLAVGSKIKAGDVIGYMGRTGYSRKENVNGMNKTHLHFGMQLIFDESQKDCMSEIWIDVYEIVNLLGNCRSAVVKDPETKNYNRVYDFNDLSFVPRD